MTENDQYFLEITNGFDAPSDTDTQDSHQKHEKSLDKVSCDGIDYIRTILEKHSDTHAYSVLDYHITEQQSAKDQDGTPSFSKNGIPLRTGILIGLEVTSRSSEPVSDIQLATSISELLTEVIDVTTSQYSFANSLHDASWRYYTYRSDTTELVPTRPEPSDIEMQFSPLIEEVRHDLGFNQDDHLKDILTGFGLVMSALYLVQKK